MKGEEIIKLVEAHLGYTMPSPIRVVAEDWMRLKSQLAIAESRLAVAVEALEYVATVNDGSASAYEAKEALAKIEEMK